MSRKENGVIVRQAIEEQRKTLKNQARRANISESKKEQLQFLQSPDPIIQSLLKFQRILRDYSGKRENQWFIKISELGNDDHKVDISAYTHTEIIRREHRDKHQSSEEIITIYNKSAEIGLFYDDMFNPERYRIAAFFSQDRKDMKSIPSSESKELIMPTSGKHPIVTRMYSDNPKSAVVYITAATPSLEEKLPFSEPIRTILRGEINPLRRMVRKAMRKTKETHS